MSMKTGKSAFRAPEARENSRLLMPRRIKVIMTLSPLLGLILMAALSFGRLQGAEAAVSTVFTQGSPNVPEVALTFDDGPSIHTPQVLATLQQFNVKGTFFLWGQHVQQFPAYAQQELAAGHVLGNHTFTHPNLTTLSNPAILTELTSTQNIIRQTTGFTPTLFRPPFGAYNTNVLALASQVGLPWTITWSYAPLDWEMPPVDVIVSRVLSNTTNGSIILLHDGGGDRSHTVAALPAIIQGLQARGLRLVTVPQLLADAHK